MTTHEAESQPLDQDQENYIARNPNKDLQKKRKRRIINVAQTIKTNIKHCIIG